MGPVRQRLGLGWVIAPLVVGLILVGVLAFGWYSFERSKPGPGFIPAGSASFLITHPHGDQLVVHVPGNTISVDADGDGRLIARSDAPCRGYPVKVYQGEVYVDPAHPGPCP